MMRQLILAMLIFAAPSAYAGPINDVFGEGVFGLKWGASMTDVRELFPKGEIKVMSGITFYESTDGRTLFGIERNKDHYIRLGFDAAERFQNATIEFPSGTSEFGHLLSVLNTNFEAESKGVPNQTGVALVRWPPDNGAGISMMLLSSAFTGNDTLFMVEKKLNPPDANKKIMGF